jgi:hypothetical protein
MASAIFFDSHNPLSAVEEPENPGHRKRARFQAKFGRAKFGPRRELKRRASHHRNPTVDLLERQLVDNTGTLETSRMARIGVEFLAGQGN